MSKIVSFQINKGEDGYFIASANDYAITTQAKTLDELVLHIQEAVDVHFGDDTIHQLPPVMVNFDLSSVAYA